MPKKINATSAPKKKSAPLKKKQEAAPAFQRKVNSIRKGSASTKMTVHLGVYAYIYRLLKTAPLNVQEVCDIANLSMTGNRVDAATRDFNKIMDRLCTRFETALRKKGHDDVVDFIKPIKSFASEYAEETDDDDAEGEDDNDTTDE